MKKIVLSLICFVLVLCGNVTIASANDSDDYIYTYPENEFTDQEYYDTVIRDEIEDCGYSKGMAISDYILGIEDNVFWDNTSLEKIELGENIQSISEEAFNGVEYFEDEETWEAGVLYIDDCLVKANPEKIGKSYEVKAGTRIIADGAFRDCTNLESVTLPNSIEFVGKEAFAGTRFYGNEANWENGFLYAGQVLIAVDSSKVEGEVAIKEGTTCIANRAFEGCEKIVSIICPDSLMTIGQYAFADCNSLKGIYLGEKVSVIGVNAFAMCESLERIELAEGNNNFVMEGGILYDRKMDRVIRCPQQKRGDIIIPEGVEEIGEYAFSGCDDFFNLYIPESCVYIGEGAFSYCTSVGEIVLPDELEYIGWWAFTGCHSIKEIMVPDSVYVLSPYAFQDCSSLATAETGDRVTEVRDGLFDNCKNLSDVQLGSSVKDIASDAFLGTALLSEENFEDDMLILSNRYLISVSEDMEVCHVPDSIQYIAYGAFDKAIVSGNLEEIHVNENVSDFKNSAFFDADDKVKVFYDGSYSSFWYSCDIDTSEVKLYTNDYYRILWTLGVIVAMLIVVLVGVGLRHKKAKKLREEWEEIFSDAMNFEDEE